MEVPTQPSSQLDLYAVGSRVKYKFCLTSVFDKIVDAFDQEKVQFTKSFQEHSITNYLILIKR